MGLGELMIAVYPKCQRPIEYPAGVPQAFTFAGGIEAA